MDKNRLAQRQAELKAKNSSPPWTPRKSAMLRAFIIDGLRLYEIAKKFKCTTSTLSNYRGEDEWKKREAAMKEDVYGLQKTRLASLVDPAIDALQETVRSSDESIKLRAATEILDRTGYPKGLVIDTEMKPVINLFLPGHLKGVVDVIDVEGFEDE